LFELGFKGSCGLLCQGGVLNQENVRPPRGRKWNASAINGNLQRGTGVLQNELYAGRLIWNKVRMVKDPDTGRRVSRPNPKGEWQSADVPELAIVSRDLFHAAQKRKQARGCTHPNYQRRPRHILSGLLRCGACGSGMSTNGRDKSGRIRIRCSAATESGTCPDPKTFYLETVEKAVLSGLSAELRRPEVIAEYVKTYHEERKRLAAESDAKRMRLERHLGEISREIDRLVDGIAKGVGDPNDLGARMNVLSAERKTLSAEFEAEPPPVNVLAFHPAVLARYAEQLAKLQDALAKGINAGDSRRDCPFQRVEAMNPGSNDRQWFRVHALPSGPPRYANRDRGLAASTAVSTAVQGSPMIV
jgi:site-specific DNA recombinase